ncbi:F-box/kelch-repeat protein At3g06240-like [Papaver somniferum]|uniref:F-box/kelch-repeat protein At3g06240-like n=1 Tax=Papaver somniferum TaxID=3469 RepID=UPI000E6F8FD9|nr:F-box/kelch-repeat protein At3g06240-like [Papaver somniferum]
MPRSPNQDYEKDIGIYGFGYNYNIDDYKVFKIVDVSGETTVEVYTLGLDSWKSILTIPYRFDANRTAGVLVNGSLHWLGETGDEDIFNTIISLDISNDGFEEVKLPKETLEDGHLFGNVELLEGCLCVLSYIYKVRYEVWVMRDYGVQESWTKRYVISHERIMDGSFVSIMWTFTKNDEILLQGQNGLILYDLGHSIDRVPEIGTLGSPVY